MSVFTAVRLLPTEESVNEWIATSSRTIAHDRKEHVFDHVFSSHNNAEVYNSSCSLIVERVVDGYNGTIAAYGQSGAGKTHSLLGTEAEKGVLQLAVSHLLQLINQRTTVQYMVKMSAFEIYNENLVDLLDSKNSKTCRIIGEKVIGAVEEIVESNEHFLRVCQEAQNRRSVGETKLNQKSSRSHAVFELIVESCQVDDRTGKQSSTVSKLVVLDLAGSENARTMVNATQTAESRKINLSLLALSRVISDLAENPNSKILTFRDTLLTRILKPVLGGNSQFLLLCCIRKAASSETASTISFGQKAKKMPNHAVKNVESEEATLPALLAQISDLKRQLEQRDKDTASQDKLRLEELLRKVLNVAPADKKTQTTVPKRRHSIAFGGNYSSNSLDHRQPRLSVKVETSDRFLILEEQENEMIGEEATKEENQKVEFDDPNSDKENANEEFTRMLKETEKLLAEEKEKSNDLQLKSNDLQLKLTEAMQKAKRWERKEMATAEKYSDMKQRGLQMLDEKDGKLKTLEDLLAQKEAELAAMAKELQDEKKKRQKAKQEMIEANQLVKNALEQEKQLRKEEETEHLVAMSEQKALQEHFQARIPSRGVRTTDPAVCSISEHLNLASKCDVLIRQREILIASLSERTSGREDNYNHPLTTRNNI